MNDVCVPAEWLVKLRELAYGQVDIAITADSPPPHTKYIDVDRLRDLVDAVERPSEEYVRLETAEKYRARAEAAEAKLTAPVAPPSEPLCQCGHTSDMHDICHFDHNQCLCGCRVFTPPRPSISDEAEALDARTIETLRERTDEIEGTRVEGIWIHTAMAIDEWLQIIMAEAKAGFRAALDRATKENNG